MNTPWYKVDHPWFDSTTAYRPIAFTLPSETAWGHLTFVLISGHTVSVQVKRCTALRPTCEYLGRSDGFYRAMTQTEMDQPWAKKADLDGENPDLDTDLQ